MNLLLKWKIYLLLFESKEVKLNTDTPKKNQGECRYGKGFNHLRPKKYVFHSFFQPQGIRFSSYLQMNIFWARNFHPPCRTLTHLSVCVINSKWSYCIEIKEKLYGKVCPLFTYSPERNKKRPVNGIKMIWKKKRWQWVIYQLIPIESAASQFNIPLKLIKTDDLRHRPAFYSVKTHW